MPAIHHSPWLWLCVLSTMIMPLTGHISTDTSNSSSFTESCSLSDIFYLLVPGSADTGVGAMPSPVMVNESFKHFCSNKADFDTCFQNSLNYPFSVWIKVLSGMIDSTNIANATSYICEHRSAIVDNVQCLSSASGSSAILMYQCGQPFFNLIGSFQYGRERRPGIGPSTIASICRTFTTMVHCLDIQLKHCDSGRLADAIRTFYMKLIKEDCLGTLTTSAPVRTFAPQTAKPVTTVRHVTTTGVYMSTTSIFTQSPVHFFPPLVTSMPHSVIGACQKDTLAPSAEEIAQATGPDHLSEDINTIVLKYICRKRDDFMNCLRLKLPFSSAPEDQIISLFVGLEETNRSFAAMCRYKPFILPRISCFTDLSFDSCSADLSSFGSLQPVTEALTYKVCRKVNAYYNCLGDVIQTSCSSMLSTVMAQITPRCGIHLQTSTPYVETTYTTESSTVPSTSTTTTTTVKSRNIMFDVVKTTSIYTCGPSFAENFLSLFMTGSSVNQTESRANLDSAYDRICGKIEEYAACLNKRVSSSSFTETIIRGIVDVHNIRDTLSYVCQHRSVFLDNTECSSKTTSQSNECASSFQNTMSAGFLNPQLLCRGIVEMSVCMAKEISQCNVTLGQTLETVFHKMWRKDCIGATTTITTPTTTTMQLSTTYTTESSTVPSSPTTATTTTTTETPRNVIFDVVKTTSIYTCGPSFAENFLSLFITGSSVNQTKSRANLDSTYDIICSKIEEYTACLNERVYSSSFTETMIRGIVDVGNIRDTLSYVCQHRSVFLDNTECSTGTSKTTSLLSGCTSSFQNAIAAGSLNPQLLCRAVVEMSVCVAKEISQCNVTLGQTLDTVFRKMWRKDCIGVTTTITTPAITTMQIPTTHTTESSTVPSSPTTTTATTTTETPRNIIFDVVKTTSIYTCGPTFAESFLSLFMTGSSMDQTELRADLNSAYDIFCSKKDEYAACLNERMLGPSFTEILIRGILDVGNIGDTLSYICQHRSVFLDNLNCTTGTTETTSLLSECATSFQNAVSAGFLNPKLLCRGTIEMSDCMAKEISQCNVTLGQTLGTAFRKMWRKDCTGVSTTTTTTPIPVPALTTATTPTTSTPTPTTSSLSTTSTTTTVPTITSTTEVHTTKVVVDTSTPTPTSTKETRPPVVTTTTTATTTVATTRQRDEVDIYSPLLALMESLPESDIRTCHNDALRFLYAGLQVDMEVIDAGVDYMCRNIQEFVGCLKKKMAASVVPADVLLMKILELDGIGSALRITCARKSVFVSKFRCMSNVMKSKKFNQCRTVMSFISTEPEKYVSSKAVCRKMVNFIDCLETVMWKCGSELSPLLKKILGETLRPSCRQYIPKDASVMDAAHLLQGSKLSTCLQVFYSYDFIEEQFSTLCKREINDVSSCLSDGVSGSEKPIDQFVSKLFDGNKVESAITSACSKYEGGLRRHMPCMVDKFFLNKNIMNRCMGYLTDGLDVIIHKLESPTREYRHLCRSWGKFASCMEVTITKCSEDAGKAWMHMAYDALSSTCKENTQTLFSRYTSDRSGGKAYLYCSEITNWMTIAFITFFKKLLS